MLLTSLELLATVPDLADRTGQDLDLDDAQALRMLADASALFRSLTGQRITFMEDDTQELAGTWDRTLKLPQLPVTALSAVSMRCPGEIVFTTIGDYTPPTRRGKLYRPGGWGGPDAAVNVTYSHGQENVPDDVRTTVISMAQRGLNLAALQEANPTGIGEWTVGPVHVGYDAGLTASLTTASVGLTSDESAVIAKYAAWAA